MRQDASVHAYGERKGRFGCGRGWQGDREGNSASEFQKRQLLQERSNDRGKKPSYRVLHQKETRAIRGGVR